MVNTDGLERYAERINRMLAEMAEAIARIGEAIIERFRDMAESLARFLSKNKRRRVGTRKAFAFTVRRNRMAYKGTKEIKRPFTATRNRRPGNGRQGGREGRKRQA